MNILRPIDNRFTIDGVAMPRPNYFIFKDKWINNGDNVETNINNGEVILAPICKKATVIWKYSLISHTQLMILVNAIRATTEAKYKQGFVVKTIDQRFLNSVTFTSYQPDDFEIPQIAFKRGNEYYYTDVEIELVSKKDDMTWS